MGELTHQYSSEEIIRRYCKHKDNYSSIITDLEKIMKSAYIKEQNIGSFLYMHLRFCNETVNVLKDAVDAIKNNKVDENICIRLETLFRSCAKEHKDLEDTYNRVSECFTKEFYEYENIHKRLREECDSMEYCDETVKFVRAMIRNNSNYLFIIGNNNNAQVQQDVRDSSQTIVEEKNKTKNTGIEIEKISLKRILRNKACEAIAGFVLLIISIIYFNINYKGFVNALREDIKIFLLIAMVVFFIFGVCLLCRCIFDSTKLLKLLENGNFVELESNEEWVDKVYKIIHSSENLNSKDIRNTGKCYINIEGEVYKIKGKECPYCETQPIGNMHLIYSNFQKRYFWECSQNPSHMVEFDYKKKF